MVAVERCDHLLDIGCGSGLQTNIIGRHAASITGIDISKNDIDRANSEKYLVENRIDSTFVQTSIEQAGFNDAQFDKVVSICVLEHIADDDSALREAYRVLKPGGKLLLSVDALQGIEQPETIAFHKEKYAVHRYYTAEILNEKLRHAGFESIKIKPLLQQRKNIEDFAAGVHGGFQYRYFESVWKYWRLSFRERINTNKKPPIYLLACARKNG